MKNYVLWVGCALAAVCVCFMPEIAMAVDAIVPEKPVVAEFVDFDGVFTTIKTIAQGVIVAAIGLGLSVWGVRFMFGLVKSFGRG